MNSLDNFNHILQCALDSFLEFLLIRVKGHVFFLDADVEKTHFSVAIPHLIK